MILKKKLIFLPVLIVFSVSLFSGARAAEMGTLGITPASPDPNNPLTKSWFIYTAEIGREIKDQVRVVNLTDKVVRAKVFSADAVTTPDGAYTIKEELDKRDIGTWINLAENIVDLQPKETKIIDFVLRVPANAEVGDHMGAIMVQEAEKLEGVKEGGTGVETGIKIAVRVGTRVYLTIPGEIIKNLLFKIFSWERKDGRFYFNLELENTGNSRIEPRGEITLTNILGQAIDKISIPHREVFPKDKIVLPVEWEKSSLLWARYGGLIAKAKVSYADKTLEQTINIFTVPWIELGALLGLIAIIVFVRRVRRKRE